MATRLPSGRWRPRIRHPRTGKHINPATVIGGPTTYEHEADACRAEDQARDLLRANARAGVTVAEYWVEWTTDPLWLRRSESTNIHNRERTAKFAAAYGQHAIGAVGDEQVAEWLKGGRNLGTVPALRAFFNDAGSAPAGRLVRTNPFANLGLRQSKGRRNIQPPTQVQAATLIDLADELTPPSFAAYLCCAIFEGYRPGEADALRWTDLDFQAPSIHIERQWNVKARKFTLPKHEVIRTVAMTDPARDRLLILPRESEWVFTTLRGTHYTPSARSYHWNRVRCAAGLGSVDLYTCTRHYFAWYAWNVLRLDPEDIAQHFGHQDGGELVRKLYGHFDTNMARERVHEAFAQAPAAPVPLAVVANA